MPERIGAISGSGIVKVRLLFNGEEARGQLHRKLDRRVPD
jgi:hypothetical protein